MFQTFRFYHITPYYHWGIFAVKIWNKYISICLEGLGGYLLQIRKLILEKVGCLGYKLRAQN